MTDDASTPTTHGAVLCAGFGTRMSPITDAIPKPLIPFLNTPLVTYAINHLRRAGIDRIAFNLHHLADAIPPVVDKLAPPMGVEPVYAREWEIQGTAGGIRGIWKALDAFEGTLVVLNGDSVMNLDLDAHLQAHRASGAMASLVVRPRDDDQPGKVWLGEDAEQILGLRDHRHPDARHASLTEYDFTGVHIIETELLDRLELEPGDIITELYGPMLEAGEAIHVSVMEGFWAALDTPKLYLQTTKRCLEEPDLFEQAPLPEPLQEGMFVYRPGGIDDKARLATPVFVGMHATVGSQCKVGPHAVIDGVELRPHAVVRNAVLYGMGQLEGEWSDCVGIAGKIAAVPVASRAEEE